MSTCPCQTDRDYASCCGPLHAGGDARDAEALMRSRYSAYVCGDAGYLMATWHPDTRPASLDLDTSATTRWLGLSIKRHEQHDADHATVEFVARYRVGGGAATRLHEISRFVRLDQRWRYVDGTFPGR